MYIANIKVSHKTAPHKVIDRLSLAEKDKYDFYRTLLRQDEIAEAILLQTCNRFEVYFCGKKEDIGKGRARKFMLDWFGADIAEYVVVESYRDTVNHLFRTVASIDSLIVGENQILSQTKEAFEYASEQNFAGPILSSVFQKAISVGKKVRTNTKISEGKVSISSAAVDHANQHNPLEKKRVGVVGTGNMASLVAEYLNKFECSELVVFGRTPANIEKFCRAYSCRSAPFSELETELKGIDLLFSATACPRVLITREVIERAARNRDRPLTLIDIATPADIDPTVSDIENVQYFSFEDLKEISEKNMDARHQEIEKAEEIIDVELGLFMDRIQNFHLEGFITPMSVYIEEIRERELEKALSLLDNSNHSAQILMEGLSKSLTKKIMHNFMTNVRSSGASSTDMERFLTIFTGEKHVPKYKDEKVKK